MKSTNSVFALYYHIILTVKYRKQLLDRYDLFVKEQIIQVAKNKNFEIEKMESDKDHIHLLISARPSISPSKIVSDIKQMTTYYLWNKFEDELKKEFWNKRIFWSPSYFINSIGSVSKEAIEKYINDQKINSSTSLKRK